MYGINLSKPFFEKTNTGVFILNEEKCIVDFNYAAEIMTGYKKSETKDKEYQLFRTDKHSNDFYVQIWNDLDEHGIWEGEVWNKHKDGYDFLVYQTIFKSYDRHKNVFYIVLSKDITDMRNKEKKYEEVLFKDVITGLTNKHVFEKTLDVILKTARRREEKVAVMFFDIARFQYVNDTFGYDIGDMVLKEMAERVNSLLPEDAIMTRQNSDIFIIACPDTTYDETVSFLEILKQSFKIQPFIVKEQEIYLNLSIGVTIYPEDGKTKKELFRNADLTRARVKELGTEVYQFYTPSLNVKIFEKLLMESSLRKAIDNNEFELYYQPQINLKTDEITGLEALIRWNHPKLGVVSPMNFIPLAEETGLINPIGEWTIKEAAKQVKIWQEKFHKKYTMAVNLSPMQFSKPGLVEHVRKAIKENDIEPDCFELEITEGMMMENETEYLNILNNLREIGVKISIDDFGTGYSSLAYLAKFPIDFLKIDRSFVQNSLTSKVDSTIVNTIVVMSHELGMVVVAEGVETSEHLHFLKKLQCDYAQGYYLAKPLSAKDMEDFLEKNKEKFQK